jgi:hypothetical protein
VPGLLLRAHAVIRISPSTFAVDVFDVTQTSTWNRSCKHPPVATGNGC